MGGFISRFWFMMFPAKEYKIIVVGLDNAGKTTTLYKLHLGEVVTTNPTVGSNVEELVYKNIRFEVSKYCIWISQCYICVFWAVTIWLFNHFASSLCVIFEYLRVWPSGLKWVNNYEVSDLNSIRYKNLLGDFFLFVLTLADRHSYMLLVVGGRL